MKVAILQSNYIPWKGYFDIINSVDEFVLYDDVQFTRRDWRNRNQIKTSNGLLWLTIPVDVKGKYAQKINETVITDSDWPKKHWKTISYNYAKAKYFKEYKDFFEDLYMNCKESFLSQVNFRFIMGVNSLLQIKTKITKSGEFELPDGRSEKLLAICKKLKADEYLSGPSAENYLDVKLFLREDIKVSWMNYSGYPEYVQLYPPFEHAVSIIDLIFNAGPEATLYMKSFSGNTRAYS